MRPGHKARLLTSDLRGSSSPQCLVFYFHMYGSGSGILSVLLREGGRRRESLLWRRRGEQGIGWMRAMVDYHCDVRHQVRNVIFTCANPIKPGYVEANGRYVSSVSSRSYLKPSEGRRYAATSPSTTSNLNVDRAKVRITIGAGPEQRFTSITYALSRPADPGDVTPFSGFNEYFNEIE